MTITTGAGSWLLPGRFPAAPLELYCFAHAGGGPAAFGTWRTPLSPWFDLVPVILPGREARLRETPCRRVEDVVPAIVEAIAGYTTRPFALLGHSLGAAVAFEVARDLERRAGLSPVALVSSARAAPERVPRAPHYSAMNAEELKAAMVDLEGTPQAVLDHPGLLEFLMPAVIADFAMNEAYLRRPGPPLACPVLAMAGERDPEVTVEQVLAWRHETSADFHLLVRPGDHFFLFREPQPVWRWLRGLLLTGQR